MTILGLSITFLVELAFQFCRFNDRKRKRERPDWMDLDDEQGSGPIDAPTPVGSASPIGSSTSIKAAPIERPQPVHRAPAAKSSTSQKRGFENDIDFGDVL